MSGTQLSGDTRYLFRRDKTWWVKLAVPRQLRDSLGYDLRRSLRTRDLNEARQARWEAIEEFRDKIEAAQASQGSAAVAPPSAATKKGNGKERSQGGAQKIGEHIVEIRSSALGQSRDRRSLAEQHHRQLHAEALLDRDRQFHRHQRIHAESLHRPAHVDPLCIQTKDLALAMGSMASLKRSSLVTNLKFMSMV